MDAERFDRMVTLQAQTQSRRGALRWLAGAVVAGAGLARLGDDDALAARRGAAEAKGNGKGKKVCRPGRRVARLTLPADGSAVETPVLKKQQGYRLRVTGYVGLAIIDPPDIVIGGPPAVDAGFGFTRDAQPRTADRVRDLDWGVAVDGVVPAWGSFNPEHEYETEITGRGKALSLALIYDTTTFQADGEGELIVAIECA